LSPTITKGRGSSLLGGGLELEILSVLASSDFPKIDFVKSPPSLDLPYPPMQVWGKLIIGIDQSQENYRKCLFVVKEKGTIVNAVLVSRYVCHQ